MIRAVLAVICIIAAAMNLAHGAWIPGAGFAVLGLLLLPTDRM